MTGEKLNIYNPLSDIRRDDHGLPTPTSVDPADRDYLTMLYEEHAEEARQHETLRAGATGLFVALIAGLLAFAVGEPESLRKVLASGILVCGISILGAILNRKHYERNRMHVNVLTGMSEALAKDLTNIYQR